MSSEILPIAAPREAWAWVRREARGRRGAVALMLLSGILGAAATVVPVYALGVLVDRVVQGAPRSALLPIAVAITVAALCASALLGLTAYLVSRLGEGMLAVLRESALARAMLLPSTTLERIGKGDLLSRTSADVSAVGKAVSEVIPTVINALLLGAVSVVAMLGLDWRLGLAGMVAIPLYVAALRWYLPRSAPRYALERKAVAERSQALVESVQGVRTVRAYRIEDQHLSIVAASSARARDITVDVFTLLTRFVGRINRAEFVGLSAILVVGYFLVQGDYATVGQTTAAALLFHRLFNPIGALLFTFNEVQAAGASLCRLVGVAEGAPQGRPLERESAQTPVDAELNLRDIRFSYDGAAEVLRGVSLRVAPGQKVALVGSTGAGKTTLAAIGAGILVPSSGTATIGGVNLAEMGVTQLRRQVAIVSQEVHVFAGTLADDLRLARPDASAAQIRAALDAVGARPWVDALPDGWDTAVGEGGHELTAAQAQQLALARVLLADPAVVILDEATAEAGSLGARDLEDSANAVTQGRTALVVAHRLTQAASADWIVVLEHGEIVEQGAHDDLLAAGGRYALLWSAWRSQLPARR
jgi:ATP-binding cassette subfamily C protein